MTQSNSINISVFLTLTLSTIILLAGDLANLASFDNNGPVSTLCIVILLSCFGLSVGFGLIQLSGRQLDWFFLAYAFVIYTLREANFHTLLSPHSLTEWQTYTLPHVPFSIKLSGAVSLFVLFMIISYLLSRYLFLVINALKSGKSWAVSTATWAILLVLSRLMHLYLSRTSKITWQKLGLEEMLELSAAIFACLALIQFFFSYTNKYKDYFS
jgi:hypothetical protein